MLTTRWIFGGYNTGKKLEEERRQDTEWKERKRGGLIRGYVDTNQHRDILGPAPSHVHTLELKMAT